MFLEKTTTKHNCFIAVYTEILIPLWVVGFDKYFPTDGANGLIARRSSASSN